MKEEKYGLSDDVLIMGGLIGKYVRDEINPGEKALLDQWIAKSEKNKQLFEELTDMGSMHQRLEYFYNAEGSKEAAAGKVMEQNFPTGAVTRRLGGVWRRMTAAAAVILLLATGAYFWFNRDAKQEIVGVETGNAELKNDIAPGQAKAVLTLSDGRRVVLDSASSQIVAMQGNVSVKNKNGQLIYTSTNNGTEVIYNTLSTAKAQTYATVLADGSKVWLNSASSIRYPVAFFGKERLVEIEGGEAYFEVAHNKAKPFKVLVNGVQVEVTGTSFNIQAYRDEQMIRTTLLEGGVRINPSPSSGSKKTISLKPRQQAQVSSDKSMVVIDNVDVDQVIAWKNGLFQFNNDDLKTVLRHIARWYDVEVVFNGPVPNTAYGGTIRMDSKLSEVLVILEKNNIHFKIDGKKIIVSP